MLCCIPRDPVFRPPIYTHLRLNITKKDKRELELIPIHDLPFLSVPNFPLTSLFPPPGSVKQFKFLYFTTSFSPAPPAARRTLFLFFSSPAVVAVRPTYISVRQGQPSISLRGCANLRPRFPAKHVGAVNFLDTLSV